MRGPRDRTNARLQRSPGEGLDRVLAGMNANVWDVQDDIVALVKAGYSGKGVDLARLANPDVPLNALLG